MGYEGKGQRKAIRAVMYSKKNKLWSHYDVMEKLEFELDLEKIKGIQHALWTNGEIKRHKIDHEEYGARFAYNIDEDNVKPYVKTKGFKITSKEPVTKEELEAFFEDMQNLSTMFGNFLSKSMEFEVRLTHQLENNEKINKAWEEMRSRMDQGL